VEAPAQGVPYKCAEQVLSFLVSTGGARGDTPFTPWDRVALIPCHSEAREFSPCHPRSIWEQQKVGEGGRREKMLLKITGQVL